MSDQNLQLKINLPKPIADFYRAEAERLAYRTVTQCVTRTLTLLALGQLTPNQHDLDATQPPKRGRPAKATTAEPTDTPTPPVALKKVPVNPLLPYAGVRNIGDHTGKIVERIPATIYPLDNHLGLEAVKKDKPATVFQPVLDDVIGELEEDCVPVTAQAIREHRWMEAAWSRYVPHPYSTYVGELKYMLEDLDRVLTKYIDYRNALRERAEHPELYEDPGHAL
jgi:hypothetical protein